MKKTRVKKNCIQCGIEFEPPLYRVEMGYGKFCSRKCYGISKTGIKFSKKHKLKISKARKGKKRPPFSKEWIENMSKTRKGRQSGMLGHKHSEETKRRISIAKKGKPLKKACDRKTILNKQIRTCSKYYKWRSDIFERDNWVCQTCNKRSKAGILVYLQAHHIISLSKLIKENNIKILEEALENNKLWDLDNGITLCKECHGLIPKK